jgi:hypothetical protein
MKTQPTRAYLLMEAAVGGAMAAVILAGLLTLIASGRVANTAATRDITANQLVTELMEQERAAPFPPPAVAPTNVTAAGGNYSRSAVVDGTGCPEVRVNPSGGPNLSMPCVNVTVSVTFNNNAGPRTTTASMRMYQ